MAVNNARIMRVKGDAAAAAAKLNRSVTVEYAAVNGEVTILAEPNDARFGELYGLHNTGSTGGTADADIDAPEGWDAAGLGTFPETGGAKIGIVDTGIDANHEDLAGKVVDCAAVNAADQVVEGECADGHGHGTHVAGTAAAKANNSVGVAGVAFNADLAICRGLDASGSGTFAGVANCVTWLASKGVDVVSMSLGGSAKRSDDGGGGRGGLGRRHGHAARGSRRQRRQLDAELPGRVRGGRLRRGDRQHGHRAPFSTFNDDVEIAAPGVNVLSTQAGGGYVAFSGTSMATPRVSGVAALIAGSAPDATPADVRARRFDHGLEGWVTRASCEDGLVAHPLCSKRGRDRLRAYQADE